MVSSQCSWDCPAAVGLRESDHLRDTQASRSWLFLWCELRVGHASSWCLLGQVTNLRVIDGFLDTNVGTLDSVHAGSCQLGFIVELVGLNKLLRSGNGHLRSFLRNLSTCVSCSAGKDCPFRILGGGINPMLQLPVTNTGVGIQLLLRTWCVIAETHRKRVPRPKLGCAQCLAATFSGARP